RRQSLDEDILHLSSGAIRFFLPPPSKDRSCPEPKLSSTSTRARNTCIRTVLAPITTTYSKSFASTARLESSCGNRQRLRAHLMTIDIARLHSLRQLRLQTENMFMHSSAPKDCSPTTLMASSCGRPTSVSWVLSVWGLA